MIFKDGKKYFGIRFYASTFASFANDVRLNYTFQNGNVEISDDCVHDAIINGLAIYADNIDCKVSVVRNYALINDVLLILMAALIDRFKRIEIPDTGDDCKQILEPCQE